jgi:hypothetical protein
VIEMPAQSKINVKFTKRKMECYPYNIKSILNAGLKKLKITSVEIDSCELNIIELSKNIKICKKHLFSKGKDLYKSTKCLSSFSFKNKWKF